MSCPHPAIAWSILLLSDFSPGPAEPAKSTDGVQVAMAVISLVAAVAAALAAFFAYRTLCQLRQASHEEAVRNTRAQTLKDVEPAYRMAKNCDQALKRLSKSQQRKPERKQQIEESLNRWEGVAIGVAAGVYDDQLVYDSVGKFIQQFYRKVSWFVRESRLEHPHYFDELEGLIERINEIDRARYEIDEPAIRRLRQLYVPGDILKLLDSLEPKREDVDPPHRSRFWDALKRFHIAPLGYRFRTHPLTYPDRERFCSHLDQHARAHGAWIDFYKPTIFREARAKLPPIYRLTQKKCQDLNDEQKKSLRKSQKTALRESLTAMMKKIHVYTGGKYPPKKEDEILDWVEVQEGRTDCRFLALANGQDLDSRYLKIVGHVALEDLYRSEGWKLEFGTVMGQTMLSDKQKDYWKPENFFLIRELHVDDTDKSRADHGFLLYRRLLRRALEAVEERHLHDRKTQKRALLALAHPADNKLVEKFEAQTKIIDEEGGFCVCSDAEVGQTINRGRLHVALYVFGWGQEGKAPSGPAPSFGESDGI